MSYQVLLISDERIAYYAQQAIDIQNASNINGIAVAIHNWLDYCVQRGFDNSLRNQHPVTLMLVYKLATMVYMVPSDTDDNRYLLAYETCKGLTSEQEDQEWLIES